MGHGSQPYLKKKTRDARTYTQRERSNNLSREQHRANALRVDERNTRLWEDLQNHWKAQDDLALELATKHKKKASWMREALQRVGRYGTKKRDVSSYNAWLHMKSMELNEGEYSVFHAYVH